MQFIYCELICLQDILAQTKIPSPYSNIPNCPIFLNASCDTSEAHEMPLYLTKNFYYLRLKIQ